MKYILTTLLMAITFMGISQTQAADTSYTVSKAKLIKAGGSYQVIPAFADCSVSVYEITAKVNGKLTMLRDYGSTLNKSLYDILKTVDTGSKTFADVKYTCSGKVVKKAYSIILQD